MVFESYGILSFLFCHSYLDLSHYFHAQLCFHSHFIFTAQTSLGCRMSLGRLFDRKPVQLLSWTLYRIRVTEHVILKVHREDAVMNDVLFAPLSKYREGASKLTGISNKIISCIKADSENAVLVPWKP